MRRIFFAAALAVLIPFAGVSHPIAAPRWPLTLREGLPTALPGWAAAPTDPLPDEEENAMGRYTEVGRFFQRIESPTSTKQFRIAVQDYGMGRDLLPAIRKAVREAAATGVEARELDLGGYRAFVVTAHADGKPTTIVTVVVSGGRLVLGEGANVRGDEAVKLLRAVDFRRVASAK